MRRRSPTAPTETARPRGRPRRAPRPPGARRRAPGSRWCRRSMESRTAMAGSDPRFGSEPIITTRARRSGAGVHTRCDRTAATAASTTGCAAGGLTISIGHAARSAAVVSRTIVRGPSSVACRATTAFASSTRPASTVCVAGSVPARSRRMPMTAGIVAMSAAVIEPIGKRDVTTSSRRAGGDDLQPRDRAMDAVAERGRRELATVVPSLQRCQRRTERPRHRHPSRRRERRG